MNAHLLQSDSRRHTILVVLTTSVLTATVLAFSVAFGLTSYNAALDRAGQHARLVSGLVSSHMNLLLLDVSERLQEISLFLETQREAPDSAKRLRELIESVQRGEPYVEGVQIAGHGGRVEAWSGRGGYHEMTGMTFIPVQSPDASRMWVGSPVRDPLHPGLWMFGLSLAHGEGAGSSIATVLLSLDAFSETLADIDMPPGTIIVVTDAEGTIYVQAPDSEGLIGTRLSGISDWNQRGAVITTGLGSHGMVTGGSQVGRFPLFVTAAYPLEEVLDPWRQHAFLYGGLSLALVLVATGLSVALVRSQIQINRQSRTLALAASTDMLTGIMNRRAFMDAARREFSRVSRYGGGLACVMIDLDHFKRINDMYGHAAGDAALSSIARFISARIREVDLFCRYGGEEFVLLLPGTNLAGARAVAESLRKGVAAMSLELGARRFSITASFGVAELGAGVATVEELLVCADQGLYLAKTGGRNQVRITPEACSEEPGDA